MLKDVVIMFMSIEDIHRKFGGQWVFMINCIKGHRGSVVGGEVVLHSENRDVVIRAMDQYDHEPSYTYFRYAGRIPEGVSVVL